MDIVHPDSLPMSINDEIFLEFVEAVFGRTETVMRHEASDGGPPVLVFVYRDFPRKGRILGVTWGLSLGNHPDWITSRPELIVNLDSRDESWPFAAAFFAGEYRGSKRFATGDVFTLNEPIAQDSRIDGLFVYTQDLFDLRPPHLQMEGYALTFHQLYPLYQAELPIYRRLGVDAFWKDSRYKPHSVRRRPVKG